MMAIYRDILVVLFISIISIYAIYSEYYRDTLSIYNSGDGGDILFQVANETLVIGNVSAPENITVTTTLTVTFTYTPEPITITRPPTGSEIGMWIAGGVLIGVFIGAGVGYAIFAQGVTVKREKRRGGRK